MTTPVQPATTPHGRMQGHLPPNNIYSAIAPTTKGSSKGGPCRGRPPHGSQTKEIFVEYNWISAVKIMLFYS